MKVSNPLPLFLNLSYVKDFVSEKNDIKQQSRSIVPTVIGAILLISISIATLVFDVFPSQSRSSGSAVSVLNLSLPFILLYHTLVSLIFSIYVGLFSPYVLKILKETYQNFLGLVNQHQTYILLLSVAVYYQLSSILFIPFFLISSWLAIRMQTKALGFLHDTTTTKQNLFKTTIIHSTSAIISLFVSFVF